ncbi:hypothetical protein [Thalassoroseus pseudoceratinae]|uniref:hypothetical protein n=1 Tax=Thalassoroseus pseudoceratinae TaxID=2713176 RepID=UPI00142168A2|nr:hypothetical protein [Thalassoroseus pseudoceratinae]
MKFNFARLGLITLGATLLIGQSASAQENTETAEKKQDTEVVVIKRQADDENGLELSVPSTWKQTKPNSRLRLAQFEIPAADADGEPVELTIFSFAGGGGQIRANIERWIGQFEAEGRKAKVIIGKAEQGQYVFVDVTGTYNRSVGPPILGKTESLPGARMLAVILAKPLEAPKAVYYLKMAGKEDTITANYDKFREAFGANKETEEEPKPPTAKEESSNE